MTPAGAAPPASRRSNLAISGHRAVSSVIPRRFDVLTVLDRLTWRDRQLVTALADHQVLTTGQLTDLAFPSLKVAQRRLLQLHRMRLVDRFRWHQPVGSQAWHYTLGPAGAALIAATRGSEPPSAAQLRSRQLRQAANPRLPHLLGLNGVFTALAAHARTHPDTCLDAWWSEKRCAEHYGQLVRPDGYGAWTEHHRHVEFFLEYDTGIEPLGRVTAKLAGYHDLATAGGPQHPVLFCLPSNRREANLHRHLPPQQPCRTGGHHQHQTQSRPTRQRCRRHLATPWDRAPAPPHRPPSRTRRSGRQRLHVMRPATAGRLRSLLGTSREHSSLTAVRRSRRTSLAGHMFHVDTRCMLNL